MSLFVLTLTAKAILLFLSAACGFELELESKAEAALRLNKPFLAERLALTAHRSTFASSLIRQIRLVTDPISASLNVSVSVSLQLQEKTNDNLCDVAMGLANRNSGSLALAIALDSSNQCSTFIVACALLLTNRISLASRFFDFGGAALQTLAISVAKSPALWERKRRRSWQHERQNIVESWGMPSPAVYGERPTLLVSTKDDAMHWQHFSTVL